MCCDSVKAQSAATISAVKAGPRPLRKTAGKPAKSSITLSNKKRAHACPLSSGLAAGQAKREKGHITWTMYAFPSLAGLIGPMASMTSMWKGLQ